jgi:hypothetical protein
MAGQRLYEAQLKEALRKHGRLGFDNLYPEPFLVFLGLAGQLDAHVSSEATTVAVPNAADLEVTSLVGRVFFLSSHGRGSKNVTVGREAQNDVAIPEYSISKRHCEFVFEGDLVSVRDVGSTNGTAVDSLKLVAGQVRNLAGGEMIMMGRFAFRFHLPRSFGVT